MYGNPVSGRKKLLLRKCIALLPIHANHIWYKKRCSGKIIYFENLIRGNILLACRMMKTTGACWAPSRVSKHCACMKSKMNPGKNETKRAWNLLCHAKESVRRAQNRKLRLHEQQKGYTVLVFCNACTNSSYFCQLHDPEDFS